MIAVALISFTVAMVGMAVRSYRSHRPYKPLRNVATTTELDSIRRDMPWAPLPEELCPNATLQGDGWDLGNSVWISYNAATNSICLRDSSDTFTIERQGPERWIALTAFEHETRTTTQSWCRSTNPYTAGINVLTHLKPPYTGRPLREDHVDRILEVITHVEARTIPTTTTP